MGYAGLIDSLWTILHYNPCSAFFFGVNKLEVQMFEQLGSVDVLIISTIVLGIALAAGKFWLDRPQNIQDVSGTIIEAAETAEILVAAAEQLWLTGRLPKTERFNFVMEQLREKFPNFDVDQLEATVESAVYWLKLSQR